jgi:hypothetical protein
LPSISGFGALEVVDRRVNRLRIGLLLQATTLQSEVCGGGEEMAVVGPDFVEAGFDGGYDMDGVAGAEGRGFGKSTGHKFNLAEDAIGYRNQVPPLVCNVVQEEVGHFCGGFPFQGTFAHLAVEGAG